MSWGYALTRFIDVMGRRLEENDHKGGWQNMSQRELLRRLWQETDELEQAIKERKNIIPEAADVANFAMMIADVEHELIVKVIAAGKGEK